MSYIFCNREKITLPKAAEHPIILELLQNAAPDVDWTLDFSGEGNEIYLGDPEKIGCDVTDFHFTVSESGIRIVGCDFSSMMRGFTHFLLNISYCGDKKAFFVPDVTFNGRPKVKFRCVHFCVFPETELNFLKKCIRSAAMAKYSHVVLEFWGMLKYDCMSELSWPFAYTKDEIREVAREANALGVEIIPMVNHLGHASSCREINGKHVVLDQDPRLEYMFDSYGWVWKFEREDVYSLLRKMREELIEVCGEGKYFHLGCDEAYRFSHNTDDALKMVDYLNRVSAELEAVGRRAIIWHDMFLSEEENAGYIATSTREVADKAIERLSKRVIIADWQYSKHGECWKTSKKFKELGFDVICAPWDNPKNVEEAVMTADRFELMGIMQTTWHTLFYGFREMVYAGALSYGLEEAESDARRFLCAHIARRAMPSMGDYYSAGWAERMTGPGL